MYLYINNEFNPFTEVSSKKKKKLIANIRDFTSLEKKYNRAKEGGRKLKGIKVACAGR